MHDDWNQLDVLFEQALDLDPDKLPQFLKTVQTDHPQLYAPLVDLLRADQHTAGFLDNEAALIAPTLLHDIVNAQANGHPDTIGPYEIVGEIGRGGMGLVYKAQRHIDDHTTQTVALKVIKRGMDSEAIVQRFTHERKLLAALNHPNIARLLDGGTTDDGRPYFVMEFIDGQPLTTYCDAHKLSVDERLELFETVCEAVEFAHQRLIVHRDLKPSNILVTESGQVKLLDFGIAKLLDEDEASAGVPLTVTGMRPLTPEYASPEQMRGEALTTASDVYALGVLLYELLVGQRPHAAKLRRELAQIVQAGDVTRPSTAVVQASTSEADTEATTWMLEARQISADQLRRRLQGDVDCIVLKALAVEVERRYGSASQLGLDVRRHLAGLPVEAQADSVGYRLGKFARRHRWGVSMSAALAMVIVGFSAFYTVNVTAERNRATYEAQKAQQVQTFLIDIFEASNSDEARSDTISARTLLEEGVTQLRYTLADQPDVRAAMYHVIGQAYRSLGLYDDSQDVIEEALRLTHDAAPQSPTVYATYMRDLAATRWKQGAIAETDSLYQTTLAFLNRHASSNAEEHAKTLAAHAQLLSEAGEHDKAATAIAQAEQWIAQDPLTETNAPTMLLRAQAQLAYRTGDLERSEALYRELLDLYEQRHGAVHPQIARTKQDVATVLHEREAYPEAVPLLKDVLAITQQFKRANHPDIGLALNALGMNAFDQGRQMVVSTSENETQRQALFDSAQVYFERGLTIMDQAVGSSNKSYAMILGNLATLAEKQGNLSQAVAYMTQTRDVYTRMYGAQHPEVAIISVNLSILHFLDGNEAKGMELAQAALAIQEAKLSSNHPHTGRTHTLLGMQYNELGQLEPAAHHLHEALTISEANLPEGHWLLAMQASNLGGVYTQLKRYPVAESLLVTSYASLLEARGTDAQTTVSARKRLHDLYIAWGKPNEAARYAAEEEIIP